MIDDIIRGLVNAVSDIRERFNEMWTGKNETRFPSTDWHYDPGSSAPPPEQFEWLIDVFGLEEAEPTPAIEPTPTIEPDPPATGWDRGIDL